MKSTTLTFIFLLIMHGGIVFAQDTDSIDNEVPVLSSDSITEGFYDLEDVVITAVRPLVQTDGAKLTYNMEEDPAAKGNTLIDALRKVPMVSVDGDNNIRINGQDNFKIYVNGKEDPSLTSNYKNIFRAMPAESVIKIEVITEPGAKYDAEGTAGILNLVTVKKKGENGYSGSLSASISKSASGASGYGRLKSGKLLISANVDYADGSLFPQKNTNRISAENMSSSLSRFQETVMRQTVKFSYLGGGMNLSYDLSDRDLLTANGNIYYVNAKVSDCFVSTSIYDSQRNISSFLLRNGQAGLSNMGITAGSSWQHDFNDSGAHTVLSYQYNHGYNRLWVDLLLKEQSGLSNESPYEHQDSKEYNNEHTLQLDFVNPFGGSHTLEAGAKAVFRRNDAYSYTYYGTTPENASESTDQRSDLVQKQDIFAAYSSYNGRFGNFSTTAGLRFEHTKMGIDFKWGNSPDFSSEMNDVVPNAAVSYSFSMASNLRLAYQMRISRPTVNQINPYQKSIFPQYIETGNPDLSSEKANKISLTYTHFGTSAGGNIGIEYSAIDNAISRYSYTVDDITYDTYANIGHNKNLAFIGFFNWTILPKMQLSVNARLTRQMLSSNQPELTNAGWSLNYGANWSYSIAGGIKLNAYGGQNTRDYNLQGYNDGWYYYGVGFSKSFLKDDALTFTLNANNFLQSHTTYKQVTDTPTQRYTYSFTNNNWNVGLTASWNFGKLKSDVKKTSAIINNDDKSTIGDKKQSGL